MKIIQLTRPALDPDRHLELHMREAQAGLEDFVQAMSPPSGWLSVEILADEADQVTGEPVVRRRRCGA